MRFASSTILSVSVAAFPELVTSPVKFALVVIAISPVPSNDVPPILLAVANAVTLEYPPTDEAGVNALAPSAVLPLVTT